MTAFASYLARVWQADQGPADVSLRRHWATYREWREMLRSGKSPLELEMPWITLLARDFLREYLQALPRATTRAFEYGSGGSGLFFLRYAAEVISVEHDRDWFAMVSDRVRQRGDSGWQVDLVEPEALSSGELQHEPSDPGVYGSADNRFAGKHFRKYAASIDRFPDESFDVVLVDGRSRPACLRHAAPKVKKNGLLVLDNAERHYYLERDPVPHDQFTLVHSSYGALISSPQLTRTNIYQRRSHP